MWLPEIHMKECLLFVNYVEYGISIIIGPTVMIMQTFYDSVLFGLNM